MASERKWWFDENSESLTFMLVGSSWFKARGQKKFFGKLSDSLSNLDRKSARHLRLKSIYDETRHSLAEPKLSLTGLGSAQLSSAQLGIQRDATDQKREGKKVLEESWRNR